MTADEAATARDGGGQAEEELKNRIRKMGSFHKIK
jgi:hypothetical protein